jgi:hypothetical protein
VMDEMMQALVLLREASQMRMSDKSATEEQVFALLVQAEALLPLGVSALWSEEHASFGAFPFEPEEDNLLRPTIYEQEGF